MLLSLLLIGALSLSLTSAQGNATINMIDTLGGTTDPASPGTYTYNGGTTVTLNATPLSNSSTTNGYIFLNWLIDTGSGVNTFTDDPLSLPVTAGTTYNIQAVFAPVLIPPGSSAVPLSQQASAAIVVVLASAGGTTSPGPGTYLLANATAFDLKANANSGWQFDHWVIAGPDLSHGNYSFNPTPTDNPYNVNHGYGNMFSYQAVFKTTGSSTSPTPTIPEMPLITLLGITTVATVAVGIYAYKRKR